MKVFCLLLLGSLAITNVSAGVNFQFLQKLYYDCLKQEGMENSEVLEYAKNQKWSKISCIQACMMEHMAILKKDGTIDVVEMEFVMGQTIDLIYQIAVDCANDAQGDRCDLIKDFHNCFLEKTIGDTFL